MKSHNVPAIALAGAEGKGPDGLTSPRPHETKPRRASLVAMLETQNSMKEELRKNQRRATVDDMFEKMKSRATLANIGNETPEASRFWKYFQLMIYSAIMVSSVQLGVQVDYPNAVEAYFFLDLVCNSIFVLEFMVKVRSLGPKQYFTSGWNIFDFTLVLTSLSDFFISELFAGGNSDLGGLPGLRVLRLLRAVRVMRMLKVFRELWLIVRGIVLSLRAMSWVILLLIIILYMCAILCTTIMQDSGHQYPGYSTRDEISGGENMEYFNPSEFFGSIPRSMYTLFQLALLTEFAEFGRPIFEIQPIFFPFFIAFIFLVTFGVLNVLIAVIVEVTMEASASLKQEEDTAEMKRKIELLDQLREFIFRVDVDRTGTVTAKQMAEAHKDENLQKALVSMGFPMDFTAEELWQLLDQDGNGSLGVSEFIRTAYRIVSSSEDQFQFQCILLSSISRLQQSVNELTKGKEANGPCSPPAASYSQPFKSSDAGPPSFPTSPFTDVNGSNSPPPWLPPEERTIPPLPQQKNCLDPNHKWHGQTPQCNESGRKKKNPIGCRIRLSRQVRRRLLSGRRALITRSRSSRENKQAVVKRVEHLLPEVRSNPTGEVRAEKLQELLKDRVHGTLPRCMLPEEVKPLLDWRKDADGNLRYCELMEGITRLAACRDDAYEYKCLMLSSVREARSEAAAARRACNALLIHSYGDHLIDGIPVDGTAKHYGSTQTNASMDMGGRCCQSQPVRVQRMGR